MSFISNITFGSGSRSSTGSMTSDRIENQTLDMPYSGQRLTAKNCTLNGGASVRDNIKLNKVTSRGLISSSMGEVEATDSTLQGINARDNVDLTNTKVASVNVSMGKLRWTNQQKSVEAYPNLNARDGMVLKKVQAGSATSSMGEIEAENSSFYNVDARDGISLSNCSAQSANSSMGRIEITNQPDEVQEEGAVEEGAQGANLSFNSVTARDGIRLAGVTATQVACEMGEVSSRGSTLVSVRARDGANLENCSIQSCDVSQGHLTYTNEARRECVSLNARDGMSLENVKVAESATTQGAFQAASSEIGSVEAAESIRLIDSTAAEVIIHIDPSKPATLRLEGNSSVLGNVTVRMRQSMPGSISMGSINIGGLASFLGGAASSYVAIGNMRQIIRDGINVTVVGSLFTVTGNITSSHSALLAKEIQIGATGTVNGKSCIYRGGTTFEDLQKNTNSTPTQASPKVILNIYGGIVAGKVIFEGCEGETRLHNDAVVIAE